MMDLGFVIMKMLSKKPMNGYTLRKNLSKLLEKEVSSGAIYPALKKLKSKKIITTQKKVEDGRYQKIHSLTDKGRLNLQAEEKIIRKLLNIDRSSVKLTVVEGE